MRSRQRIEIAAASAPCPEKIKGRSSKFRHPRNNSRPVEDHEACEVDDQRQEYGLCPAGDDERLLATAVPSLRKNSEKIRSRCRDAAVMARARAK